MEDLYGRVGKQITKYDNFPRLIGESGGKNFHLIDTSYSKSISTNNNLPMVILRTLEGAFNFSGQKCSACSILYTPDILLTKVCNYFKTTTPNFISSMSNYGVINKDSYVRLITIIEDLKNDPQVEKINDKSDKIQSEVN